jgi:hypothetical protein
VRYRSSPHRRSELSHPNRKMAGILELFVTIKRDKRVTWAWAVETNLTLEVPCAE